jgi:integrase
LKAASEYDKAPRGEGGQSTFKGQMCDMTRLYLLTGLRNRELVYLPWIHVDLDWEDVGLIHIMPFDLRVTLHVRPSAQQAARLAAIAKDRDADEQLFVSRSVLENCVPANYVKIGRTFTTDDKQEHEDQIAAFLACKVRDWDEDGRFLRVLTRIRWKQKATAGSVPLLPEARKILQRRKKAQDGSPFVFAHPDRGPLKSDFWAQFKALLRSAKLPMHFRVHDLRHTFGFTLRERGVPIETIMGLMRHANIEETMIYAKYSDKQGAKEIMRLTNFAT